MADSFSVGDLLEIGEQLLKNGWKSEPTSVPNGFLYKWVSPRGAEYYSNSRNLPSVEAARDARDNNDIDWWLKKKGFDQTDSSGS